jgi:dCTP deaminase
MGCLPDKDIRVWCKNWEMISPFDEDLLQPASYELTFDGSFVYGAKSQTTDMSVMGFGKYTSQDPYYSVAERGFVREDKEYEPWEKLEGDGYMMMPGDFFIASSKQMLKIPSMLMARFEGKSTLGRAGLAVHITAGYVDPGFEGTLTLEMKNMAPWPIVITEGDKIGQLSFHSMSSPPEKLYGEAGNHYQGQVGPTLPR